jgi:hypothetical protein
MDTKNQPDLRNHGTGYIAYDNDGNIKFATEGLSKGRPYLEKKQNLVLKEKMEKQGLKGQQADTRTFERPGWGKCSLNYHCLNTKNEQLAIDRYGVIVLSGTF